MFPGRCKMTQARSFYNRLSSENAKIPLSSTKKTFNFCAFASFKLGLSFE